MQPVQCSTNYFFYPLLEQTKARLNNLSGLLPNFKPALDSINNNFFYKTKIKPNINRLIKLVKIIYALSITIYKHIKVYINRESFLKDLLDHYVKKTPDHQPQGFFELSLEKGLELAKKDEGALVVNDHIEIKNHSLTVTTSCLLFYTIIPYEISANFSQHSLLSVHITAFVAQRIAKSYFNFALDEEELKKYDLISQGDSLDQYTFTGISLLACQGLNLLAPQEAFQAVQFTAAFVSTFPPLQNAFKRSSLGNHLSQKSHELYNQTHHLAKKQLTSFFKKIIIKPYNLNPSISKAPTEEQIDFCFDYMHQQSKKSLIFLLKKLFIYNFASSLKQKGQKLLQQNRLIASVSKGRIKKSFVDNLIEIHVKQPLVRKVSSSVDEIAEVFAEVTLEKGIGIAKGAFYIYNCEKIAKIATSFFLFYPPLAVLSFVAQGGTSQSFQELSLRVSTSSLIILTCSNSWSWFLIRSLQVGEYGFKLRKLYIKNQGITQDPLIEKLKKIIDKEKQKTLEDPVVQILKRSFSRSFKQLLSIGTLSVEQVKHSNSFSVIEQIAKETQPLLLDDDEENLGKKSFIEEIEEDQSFNEKSSDEAQKKGKRKEVACTIL